MGNSSSLIEHCQQLQHEIKRLHRENEILYNLIGELEQQVKQLENQQVIQTNKRYAKAKGCEFL
jgi:cell division protein FtsB